MYSRSGIKLRRSNCVRMKKGLIIFQKNAEPGKVKTRLAKDIGDKAAFEAYLQLVSYTHKVAAACEVDKLLFFSDYLENNLENYPVDYRFELQSGNDLGQKMRNAFHTFFAEGYRQLVIIGTDCPEISPDLIERAFAYLEENDAVIGPAEDGGYYLLGMKTLISGLFEGIPWSTSQVSTITKDFLTANNYTFAILPVLSDVDYKEDWDKFKSQLQ